jgi:hypothetical protein
MHLLLKGERRRIRRNERNTNRKEGNAIAGDTRGAMTSQAFHHRQQVKKADKDEREKGNKNERDDMIIVLTVTTLANADTNKMQSVEEGRNDRSSSYCKHM